MLLKHILQDLAKENIISSTRGPKGGFYLTEQNLNESVMSIIKIIDGEKNFSSCMLSLKECNIYKPCPLHNILRSSRSKILKK